MPDDTPSATLAWIAAKGGRVHFTCNAIGLDARHKLDNHWGETVDGAEAVVRWGGLTTLAQLRRRARCAVCNYRGPLIEVSCAIPYDDSWRIPKEPPK